MREDCTSKGGGSRREVLCLHKEEYERAKTHQDTQKHIDLSGGGDRALLVIAEMEAHLDEVDEGGEQEVHASEESSYPETQVSSEGGEI